MKKSKDPFEAIERLVVGMLIALMLFVVFLLLVVVGVRFVVDDPKPENYGAGAAVLFFVCFVGSIIGEELL